MADSWDWLSDARASVRAAGLDRHLDPDGSHLLDLASNDYLGLSRDSHVIAGAVAALEAYGAGSTGSRLVTGSQRIHHELEDALAERCNADSALVFSSGYLANLGAVTALAGPGVLVVSDGANHASLIDACRLSRATIKVVPHASPAAIDEALTGWTGRSLVVTDAVFSVDGALAPLVEIHHVARSHGALMLVDEAHGLGVLGRDGAGACSLLGLDREPDVVRTVTLSKALGAQGGAVLGPRALRDHLVDTARSFIFDTALAPASAGAALAALGLMTEERVGQLAANTRALSDAVRSPATPGPVVHVPIGDPHAAVAAQQQCRAEGVRVGCFRPPSVPSGGSCLRLTTRANLTAAEVARAAEVVLGATRRQG